MVGQVKSPDFGTFLAARNNRRKIDREDEILGAQRNAGNLLAQNNATGARNSLLNAGLLNQGIAVENLQNQRSARAQSQRAAQRKQQAQSQIDGLNQMAQMIGSVQSPEQFETLKDQFRQQGVKIPPQFESFENRDAAMRSVLSVKDQLELKLKEKNKGLSDFQKRSLDLRKESLDLQKRRQDRLESFGTTTKTFQQKFNSALVLGLNDKNAAAFASGMLRFGKDPVSDQPKVFNRVTGEEIELDPNKAQRLQDLDQGLGSFRQTSFEGQNQPTTQQVQSQVQNQAESQQPSRASRKTKTLFEQAPLATGAIQRLGNAASNITEQLGIQLVSDETKRAQQDFKFAQNNLIRTLSVNPKFPVAEMQRLEGFLKPGVFTSDQTLRQEIIALDEFLREKLAAQTDLFRDETMPRDARKSAKVNISHIQRFLKKLGAPQGQSRNQVTPNQRAINFLQQNAQDPDIARQFDEKFGQGAAQRILGQ